MQSARVDNITKAQGYHTLGAAGPLRATVPHDRLRSQAQGRASDWGSRRPQGQLGDDLAADIAWSTPRANLSSGRAVVNQAVLLHNVSLG